MYNYDGQGFTAFELKIEAILAAGNPFAGRNSKLDRSLRARRQLRDRKGRWIFMGGGIGFTVRMPDGTLYRILGRSVGASRRDGFVQVYISNSAVPGLPAGFYDVPASGSDVVEAILPGQDGPGAYRGSPTAAEIINLADLQIKDAPDGWSANRDGSFTSEGGEFTVSAPDAGGDVRLQRDGRTVASFTNPATAIARSARMDITDTADADTKQVVARLKRDVTTARRQLRDSTDEAGAAQAQKDIAVAEDVVERAIFNDPEITGEDDFERQSVAQEVAGLQAQDEVLAKESADIDAQLVGVSLRTGAAQRMRARQRQIAEARANLNDDIDEVQARISSEADSTPEEGDEEVAEDVVEGSEPEGDEAVVPVDGGIYFLDSERVSEEDVADWLSDAPNLSQIFIQGTNEAGEQELYKFVKSTVTDEWIESSFTSETIPLRSSAELAEFMRRQRTNGGLIATDDTLLNSGNLRTIADALDDLRREGRGERERRAGDFARARARARRALDGDSTFEFDEDFDPADQEVITFDRATGPGMAFFEDKNSSQWKTGDWVEGRDAVWRQVVDKEIVRTLHESLDPNKGPFSRYTHYYDFDDGTTFEVKTTNGFITDSQEKKRVYNVVSPSRSRRFEAAVEAEPEVAPEGEGDTETPSVPTVPVDGADPAPTATPEPDAEETPAADEVEVEVEVETPSPTSRARAKAVEEAEVVVENAEQVAEETADAETVEQGEQAAEVAQAEVDAEPVKPPRAPREPSIGAATGRIADMLASAETPEDVRDIINGEDITYIDFETTGFSAVPGDGELNRPLQMGIVKIVNGVVGERKNIWMNPETPLSEWSKANLKDADGNPLTDEWLATQPSRSTAMQEVIDFIGPDAIIAGQNVQFDLEVLGRTLNEQGITFGWAGTLDTRDMSAGSLPTYDAETNVGPSKTNRDGSRSPSNSLGDIVAFLEEEGFPVRLDNAHSADADALASHEVMQAMLQRAINLGTSLDFMADSSGKQAEWDAYNVEYARYRDALRAYFEATGDPDIDARMAVAVPLRRSDLAPGASDGVDVPDSSVVVAAEAAVDVVDARIDELDEQLDRSVDAQESSDILDDIVDAVIEADSLETAAAQAAGASVGDELATLNRLIDRLDRAIARNSGDIDSLMAEQDALIEQRDLLQSGGLSDGRDDGVDGGGETFLSVPLRGQNFSRKDLERRGDTLRNLNGDVVARLAPEVGNADERRARGETVVEVFEVEKGQEQLFVDALVEAKQTNVRFGSSVDVNTLEFYQNARVFINEDGTLGLALNGDEIVSAFRNVVDPNSPVRAIGAMVGKMVEFGARRLDAMDTILPYLYALEGFKPVARIDWDDQFAPADWDKDVYATYKKGEPDVVFMVFDPERVGVEYDSEEGPRVDDYDAAVAAVNETLFEGDTDSGVAGLSIDTAPAVDFVDGSVTLDSTGKPSIAALRNARIGQVVEYTFANGRKGRFMKMSRDMWRRADLPSDVKIYRSNDFRSDLGLQFSTPTDADVPSMQPVPLRGFARIDPKPFSVPRQATLEEYTRLREIYLAQAENDPSDRGRARAEETVFLLDRLIARAGGVPLPRRADRVTRSRQRRARESGQSLDPTPLPETPAVPVVEAVQPNILTTADNPQGVYVNPEAYTPSGTGVDGTTDDPRELLNIFGENDIYRAFVRALQNEDDTVSFEFPFGARASIAIEAVRDALQYAGYDTTWLITENIPAREDTVEAIDGSRPSPRMQPLDRLIRITREEELGNLHNTNKGLISELANLIARDPNNNIQIDELKVRIGALQRRIGALESLGIRNPYEVDAIDVRWPGSSPDIYRPDLVWDAVRAAYPDAEVLPNGDLVISKNTVSDVNGRSRTYSAIMTKTDDEMFYTYIREENNVEMDPSKRFTSLRFGMIRNSAKATLVQAAKAVGKIQNRAGRSNIISWFNNTARHRQAGVVPALDVIDENGLPVHTKTRILTRDALTRIKAATNSDEISEALVNTLYNYLSEYGSSAAVLNELNKSFNISDQVLYRFVDAVNEELGNRDNLDKFRLWESNNGVPLFENDRVTYVGTQTQTGFPNLTNKRGRVQIRNMVHNQKNYVYTDYVYVQFEDENGAPEGKFTLVSSHNLRIDETAGGTDGSERVGPNAISMPRPVLTTRAFQRHAARQTLNDILTYTAEYDRGTLASPVVTIDGREYKVQSSRGSVISDSMTLSTARAEDLMVGDFHFVYDEKSNTKRLAEVVGVDVDPQSGDRIITTAIPIDLGSATVAQTVYPSSFDLPFEVYREAAPAAGGSVEPEDKITQAHLERLGSAMRQADRFRIDSAALIRGYRTLNGRAGGATNMREFTDLLREIMLSIPEDGMRAPRRMPVAEAVRVIENANKTGSPNPEARQWVQRAVEAGIMRENDLLVDPEVPEDAVAASEPETLPLPTTAPIGGSARSNTPTAPSAPGTPVTRSWVLNAPMGATIEIPNFYGPGRPEFLLRRGDGAWEDSGGDVMYDSSTDLAKDIRHGAFTAYVTADRAPVSETGEDLVSEVNSSWIIYAAPGSSFKVTDPNPSATWGGIVYTLDSSGLWRSGSDARNSLDVITALGAWSALLGYEFSIVTNVRRGSGDEEYIDGIPPLNTPDFIKNASPGEYIRVVPRDGSAPFFYVARKNMFNEIDWYRVTELASSTEFLRSETLIEDGITPANSDKVFDIFPVGTSMYQWQDTPPGRTISPNDGDWFIYAPLNTTVSFTVAMPDPNGSGVQLSVPVFARKNPNGLWSVAPVFDEDLVAYPAVDLPAADVRWLAEARIYRGGQLDGFSRSAMGSGIPSPESLNMRSGPYTADDAVLSVTPEEFRNFLTDGDEDGFSRSIQEAYAKRKFGSSFHLTDIYVGMRTTSATWSASIVDDTGKKIGSTQRDFRVGSDGSLSVYHASLFITRQENRGTGFASEFKKFSDDLYRYVGVDQINITAVRDGAFIWAKMNYTWANSTDASSIKRFVERSRDRALDRGDSKDAEMLTDVLDRFNLPFDHPEFPDPIDIANLEYDDPASGTSMIDEITGLPFDPPRLMSLGRDIFQDHSWAGARYLNPNKDPRPQERKDKTAESVKKAKENKKPATANDLYVDEDGRITDASMWLERSPSGSYVRVANQFGETELYFKNGTRWHSLEYGDATNTPASEWNKVSETNLARDIGTYGASAIIKDEDVERAVQYAEGRLDTSNVSGEQLVAAMRSGDNLLVGATLVNALFNSNVTYGNLVIGDVTTSFSATTPSGQVLESPDLTVSGGLFTDRGDYAGEFVRNFSLSAQGNMTAQHTLLQITSEEARGKGFGSAFSKASENFYTEFGFESSSLDAWWDGGSFWAGKGYGWDLRNYNPEVGFDEILGEVPENLKIALETAIQENKTSAAAKISSVIERINRLPLTDRSFPTPQEILDLPAGKEILADSRWQGIKYFGEYGRSGDEFELARTAAPEFAGWEFVASEDFNTSADLVSASVAASFSALDAQPGSAQMSAERRARLESNIRSYWVGRLGDFHVYSIGNQTLLINKRDAGTPEVRRAVDLQRQLIENFSLQNGRPVTITMYESAPRQGLVGTASMPYLSHMFHNPGGGTAVSLYVDEAFANTMSPNWSKAQAPEFQSLLVGGLAHEYGHALDFDSSGIMGDFSEEQDAIRSLPFLSLELERRIKAYDVENGTNLWSSISNYVNSSSAQNGSFAPSSQTLEAMAESFTQLVAEDFFGAAPTEFARILREILIERGYYTP